PGLSCGEESGGLPSPHPLSTGEATQDAHDLAVCCCSSARIPTWGAKRARSAIGVPSPPVPPSPDTTPSASSRDWANLSDGPAGLISERLLAADVADYVSFRAACRPWRLCSTDPREHGVLDRRFHPRQWTMLRTKRGSPYRRCFMNVSTGCCRYVHLPELRGHDVFGPTTEGLLVLLDRATCVVRLLNPFTRQAADLPPATALMTQRDLERRRDGGDLAEISGTFLADDCTIAVCFAGITTLAVAKPGDAQWAVVDRGTYLSPAMSFAGRFYCATNRVVMVVETSADDHPPRLAVAAELSRPLSGGS
ncbi:uncharacterized protein LOC111256412, partial [Setaria italica]|uniref:uncharacterized protein LOC111256412 n=1 Tax=Setaria italica TaxID=4555 RepID=UPI000BE6147C